MLSCVTPVTAAVRAPGNEGAPGTQNWSTCSKGPLRAVEVAMVVAVSAGRVVSEVSGLDVVLFPVVVFVPDEADFVAVELGFAVVTAPPALVAAVFPATV